MILQLYSFLGIYPREMKTCSHKDMYTYVHRSFSHNSQTLEITQMFASRWALTQTSVSTPQSTTELWKGMSVDLWQYPEYYARGWGGGNPKRLQTVCSRLYQHSSNDRTVEMKKRLPAEGGIPWWWNVLCFHVIHVGALSDTTPGETE